MSQQPDRHRPRRRRRHPDEVQDHEGAAPGRRPQHDRPRPDRGPGGGAAAGRRGGRAPARAGRPAHPRARPRLRARRPGEARRHRRRGPGRDGGAADDVSGTVVVAYGDTPLLEGESLRDFVAEHEAAERAVSILIGRRGRPVRLRPGRAQRRRRRRGDRRGEGRHARRSARSARSTAGSSPSTPSSSLEALPRIGNDNAKGEYYLTDLVGLAREAGLTVGAHVHRRRAARPRAPTTAPSSPSSAGS